MVKSVSIAVNPDDNYSYVEKQNPYSISNENNNLVEIDNVLVYVIF